MHQTYKFGGLLSCYFRHNAGSSVHLLFILRNSNATVLNLKTFFTNILTPIVVNIVIPDWIKTIQRTSAAHF